MKKIIKDVKIKTEHGMPEGKVQLFYSKLREFIGKEYDAEKLKAKMEIIGNSDEGMGLIWGYQYSGSQKKNNQASFIIYAMYANVEYALELE